ncbi:uncharacterized protein LAJ45_02569 [Morchella importuna]|uniref:uncharacterized protein n=1 Tax=Morchella importuna TaxID=1174673 RepID=UPI001E8E3502|nr:uncharacterized protein LAJ45_02569 [Morchella importuna]KAH8153756.1 hypothetical protein LAJ45_02569 [Morchella importuna]
MTVKRVSQERPNQGMTLLYQTPLAGEPAVSTFIVIVHHETPPAERTPQRLSQAAGTPILGLFGQRTLNRLITLRIRPCLFLSSGECLDSQLNIVVHSKTPAQHSPDRYI